VLLRRLVPELGYLAVARYAWRHRGTVVRAVDLALQAPQVAQAEGVGGIIARGRTHQELDRTMPRDTQHRPDLRPAPHARAGAPTTSA
jgi:hypothetical protein